MTLARIDPGGCAPPCYIDISDVSREQLTAWAQEGFIPVEDYRAELERRRQEQERARNAK